MYHTKTNQFFPILGDPGAVSGGGKKSKRARKKFGRRKVKNDARLDFFPPPLTAPGSSRMIFPLKQAGSKKKSVFELSPQANCNY